MLILKFMVVVAEIMTVHVALMDEDEARDAL